LQYIVILYSDKTILKDAMERDKKKT
jgi:hypothetical protein